MILSKPYNLYTIEIAMTPVVMNKLAFTFLINPRVIIMFKFMVIIMHINMVL
jgi:hypothetical protein